MGRKINHKFSENWISLENIYFLHKAVTISLDNYGTILTDAPDSFIDQFNNEDEMMGWISREMDFTFCFILLAWFESRFRIDFIHRVELKFKDSISQECRELNPDKDKKDYQIAIKEIINIWITHSPSPIIRQALKNLIEAITVFRNWFAHGRYFDRDQQIIRYNFQDLFSLAVQIENGIGKDLQHYDKVMTDFIKS